jgi:ABC-2 type transport system permease protein
MRAREVLAGEWTKLRGVRSTYWTVLVAAGTAIGFSVVVAFAFAAPAPGQHAAVDPMLPGFASLEYAVLAVGVLGALAITSEFSTGLIRTTFCAVPRRRAVLAAKAAVVGTVTLVLGEVVAFASFFLAQAVLSRSGRGVSLSAHGALGAVLANGSLLCVCALCGLGLGALIRHTAGSVAALAGLIYLPAVLGLLPAPWNDRIGRFTLISAAHQVASLRPSATELAPAWSLLVLFGWPVAVLLAAAVVIARRDV